MQISILLIITRVVLRVIVVTIEIIDNNKIIYTAISLQLILTVKDSVKNNHIMKSKKIIHLAKEFINIILIDFLLMMIDYCIIYMHVKPII